MQGITLNYLNHNVSKRIQKPTRKYKLNNNYSFQRRSPPIRSIPRPIIICTPFPAVATCTPWFVIFVVNPGRFLLLILWVRQIFRIIIILFLVIAFFISFVSLQNILYIFVSICFFRICVSIVNVGFKTSYCFWEIIFLVAVELF